MQPPADRRAIRSSQKQPKTPPPPADARARRLDTRPPADRVAVRA